MKMLEFVTCITYVGLFLTVSISLCIIFIWMIYKIIKFATIILKSILFSSGSYK